MSLISIQSYDNRIATINKEVTRIRRGSEVQKKIDYHLRRKEIKWHNGFFGAHIITISVTTRKIAFALARKWVADGKY